MSNRVSREDEWQPLEENVYSFSKAYSFIKSIELEATDGIMGEVNGGHIRSCKDVYTRKDAEYDRLNAFTGAKNAIHELLNTCKEYVNG